MFINDESNPYQISPQRRLESLASVHVNDFQQPTLLETECMPIVVNFEITDILYMNGLAHSHERELQALMSAGLDGDAEAYYQLLEWLTCHLRAYYRHRFARIGHGPTEAEDLLQEALIAVHTYRHTYDRSQPFTPWIHAIARYKFLDYLRRTKVSFKDIPMESAQELTATSEVAAVESGLDLERLMSSISSKARQAI